MKVLQVNCVYKYGSTGHIVYELHSKLPEMGVESVVCYGRGKRNKDKNVYKTCSELYAKMNNALSRITGLVYGGCLFSTLELKRIIDLVKPDIVHLHCINGFFVNIYSIVKWLKDNNYKTVVTLHAEFMYTANCSHALECDRWMIGCGNCPRLKKETKSFIFDNTHKSWELMYDAFSNFDKCEIVSVSPWVKQRVAFSPILKHFNNRVILNGINTDVFKRYDKSIIRDKYGIKGSKIILHVTPYFSNSVNSIKGGRFVIELADRLKNEDIVIVVVGKSDSKLRFPRNIIPVGYISNQRELANLYSDADLTLIASMKETFSMVTAESLCCGTPVVGFVSGGPELIAIEEYSSFGAFGDVELLHANCNEMMKKKFDRNSISTQAHAKYSIESMVNNYYRLYIEMDTMKN